MEKTPRKPIHHFLCFVALVVSSLQVRAAEIASSAKAVISLSRPVRVEETLALLNQYALHPLSLDASFRVGEDTIYDSYLDLDDKTPSEIESGYISARRAFLEDLSRSDASKTAFPTEVGRDQEAAKHALLIGDYQSILISKATFAGQLEDIKRITIDEGVRLGRIEILPVNERPSQLKRGLPPIQPSVERSSAKWYPDAGTTETGESSPTTRYLRQYMKWTNISFVANESYEHEFLLYNYDNDGTYLSSARTKWPDCMPKVEYWNHSFPPSAHPYLDTRLNINIVPVCGKNEVSYTIGVAKAAALVSGTLYETYIRTAKGNAESDKFKLQAQLAHAEGRNCSNTWCVFMDDIFTLVRAWNHEVPGVVNWQTDAASLDVSLTATPSRGNAPLKGVTLSASVSGTAQGTINYTFYCNRSDGGTDIKPGADAKYDHVTNNPMTVTNLCNFQFPGTYVAKVVAERGSRAAESRIKIAVGAPDSICRLLVLARNDPSGGSMPIASPPNSSSCPSGQYTPGQRILIAASPASGWRVERWTGTEEDTSAMPTNSVVMPGARHRVTGIYTQSPTSGRPFVATEDAEGVTVDSATLSASVNPNGLPTTSFFEYGASSTSLRATAPQAVGSHSVARRTRQTVAGLTCDTTFQFRVIAVNDAGRAEGAFQTFRTTACPPFGAPPQVTTRPAIEVGITSVNLQATIIPNGLETRAFFEYGVSPQSLISTGAEQIGSSTVAQNFSQFVTGLTCNTSYYYRAAATNALGRGEDIFMTFTTAPCPQQTCFSLILDRIPVEGGELPLASPSNSVGCDVGRYNPGEQIQVTARPAPGWWVKGWFGTLEESDALINTVSMSSYDPLVTVNYGAPCERSFTEPHGGEIWKKGEPHALKWSWGGCGQAVQVQLLKLGELYDIIDTLPATVESYTWSPELWYANGDKYQIKVVNPSDPSMVALTHFFTLADP